MTIKHSGLRIIWQANAPFCATGYGVQGKYILPAFKSMPEVDDVLIFAFYGLQGGRITHRLGKHTFHVWPLTVDDWGNSTVGNYAVEFEADLVITLLDLWPLDETYGQGFLWCPYGPLDVVAPDGGLPPPFITRLKNAYLPLVYAKQASATLDRLGIEHEYIPHGVNTRALRPVPQNQKLYRKMLSWPEAACDGFVFGMVAANKGYPPRKGFPEAFEAFRQIARQHDNVWLYLHTVIDETTGGPNLIEMARAYGIGDRVLAANKHLLLSGAYDDLDMLRIYNAIDCLLMPSYSEGFGIPAIEAAACGTPVISTDAFAMTELNAVGWLVPWDHTLYMPVGGMYVLPNIAALTERMEQALYELGSSKRRREIRAQCRAFAMNYDWQTIIEQYWHPVIQRLHRELTPRHYRMPRPITENHRTRELNNGLVLVGDGVASEAVH